MAPYHSARASPDGECTPDQGRPTIRPEVAPARGATDLREGVSSLSRDLSGGMGSGSNLLIGAD